MRHLLLILFACFFYKGNTQASAKNTLYFKPVPPGFATAKIPRHQLAEDMRFWHTVIEESHVNPYHAISKKDLIALQERILLGLPDSVTHAQASFAISELIGALDEGHLGFATDPVSDSLYAFHAIRFPYIIQDIEDGALVVQQDLSNNAQKLPPPSRIISINGIPVQQLYEKYARMEGGLESWKKLLVKNYLRKFLFLDNIRSPFDITAIVAHNTIHFTSNGYNRQQADSITRSLSASNMADQPFSLTIVENIAVLEFNTMIGTLRDSFSRFLVKTFDTLQLVKPKGLIIDLRKNSGGDSGLGDTLLSYITSKPYRNASGMIMRISKHSKAVAAMRKQNDTFSKWKNGELYEYTVKELRTPSPKNNRFNGKVAVLIGPATFSSANMLTNAIKDFQLATLIGEPTGESPNDFGEVFSFMLPNTHIVATGAMKMFIRANGDDKDFTGIQPDIFVSNTSSGISDKTDRVMDRAKEWVHNTP